MLKYLEIGIWVLAGALVFAWSFGSLVVRGAKPVQKTVVVTSLLWLISFVSVLLTHRSSLHFLWMMPACLVVPHLISAQMLKRKFVAAPAIMLFLMSFGIVFSIAFPILR